MAFAMQAYNRNNHKSLLTPQMVNKYSLNRRGYSLASKHLGTVDVYKGLGYLGEGVATTSKTLNIPSKRWSSVTAFLKDFPELKIPLFISLYPYKAPVTASILYNKPIPQIPVWEQDKRTIAYQNMIKYAISKQLPIKYNSYLGSYHFPKPGKVPTPGTSDTEAGYIMHPFVIETLLAITDRRTAFDVHQTFTNQIMRYDQSNVPQSQRSAGKISDPFNAVLIKFMYPEVWEAWKKALVVSRQYMVRHLLFVDVNWEKLVDKWLMSPTAVANFEAYSSDQDIQFQEVFNVTDPKQMAPYTISYIVTKDPPPTPGNEWNNVKFWSNLFKKREGFAILQATAELYPVKVKTRATAFKEDPSFYKKVITGDWTKEVFTYIFNDFDIEVTPDAKIFVRYNRDAKTETVEWRHKKKKTWATYVGYAIIAVALTAATVGVAAGIAAAMAASASAATGGAAVPAVSSVVAPIASGGGYAAGQGAVLSAGVLSSGGYAAGTGAVTSAIAGGGGITAAQAASGLAIAGSAASKLATVSSIIAPMASIGPGAAIPVTQAAIPVSTGLVSKLATTGSQLYSAGQAVTPIVTSAAKVASTGMQVSSAYNAITAKKANLETPAPFVFDVPPVQQPIQAGMLDMKIDAKSLLLLSAFGTIAFMMFKGR